MAWPSPLRGRAGARHRVNERGWADCHLAHGLRALMASRRMRRAAGLGNLAAMAGLAVQLAPTGVEHAASLAAAAPLLANAVPMLLVLTCGSMASALLLAAGREQVAALGGGRAPERPQGHGAVGKETAGARSSGRTQGAPGESGDGVAHLIAGIGHDLRTPLNAIIGFSDIMQQELHGPLGSDRYHSYAGHIRESGVALLKTIESTLALTERLAGAEQGAGPAPVPATGLAAAGGSGAPLAGGCGAA